MWVGQAEDVQRPLYWQPLISPVLFLSYFTINFYPGSKVYWEKMGSVLWPAARAKGTEREELFCRQKRLCILLDFWGLCLMSQLFRPTSLPYSQPADPGTAGLSPSTIRAGQPGAGC